MYAMIAVSIALAIWCAGLSYLTRKEDIRNRINAEIEPSAKNPDDTEVKV